VKVVKRGPQWAVWLARAVLVRVAPGWEARPARAQAVAAQAALVLVAAAPVEPVLAAAVPVVRVPVEPVLAAAVPVARVLAVSVARALAAAVVSAA
jgi:hypothetical protein